MKRSIYLFALLALISITAGVFFSDASWIGRVGITFLHKEYNFLKIWWQGAIAIFLVYIALVYIHSTISNKLPVIVARLLQLLLLLLIIAGVYFTYIDFIHTFSHRILGRRFHYGAYLFWSGWVTICIFYMLKKKSIKNTINQNKMGQADS